MCGMNGFILSSVKIVITKLECWPETFSDFSDFIVFCKLCNNGCWNKLLLKVSLILLSSILE
jgi:hypothetical protein